MSSRKRAFDLVLAVPALVVAAPVIVVIGGLVRLTSPGPAILAQPRVGRHGLSFTCYKIRTMQAGTATVATHEAPAASVTPLGRWLRRLKLDELPQLWNVVRGDMSLVGPRPCLPVQHELVAYRWRLGVFTIRPGITGLAQARGIDMSEPLRCAEADAEYRGRASLALDLRILAATFLGRRLLGG